jgi:hypothetical protein
MNENAATPKEVRRERVLIPNEMTVGEVQKKYYLKRPAALRAKKKVSL